MTKNCQACGATLDFPVLIEADLAADPRLNYCAGDCEKQAPAPVNAHQKMMQSIREAEVREREQFGCTVDEFTRDVSVNSKAAVQAHAIGILMDAQNKLEITGDIEATRHLINRAKYLMEGVKTTLLARKL